MDPIRIVLLKLISAKFEIKKLGGLCPCGPAVPLPLVLAMSWQLSADFTFHWFAVFCTIFHHLLLQIFVSETALSKPWHNCHKITVILYPGNAHITDLANLI